MSLYWAIFLATLSTVIVPVPEEATLLAAGYAARLGRVTLAGAILMALAAVLIGDVCTYLSGRLLLGPLLRTRAGQFLFPERWRAWAERLVAGRGAHAVVIARFLVGLRGFVHVSVGASRYPFARYVAVDILVGAVEVGGLVALGYAFGEVRSHVGREIDLVVAFVLIVALFVPLLVRRHIRRREANAAGRA